MDGWCPGSVGRLMDIKQIKVDVIASFLNVESRDSFLGRTQLFLKTNPAPKGVTCQVQPVRGRELYTHFSIFCTSGKEVFAVS